MNFARLALAVGGIGAVIGCATSAPPIHHYRLHLPVAVPPGDAAGEDAARARGVVEVAPFGAAPGVDCLEFTWVEPPVRAGTQTFHRWTNRPAQMAHAAVIERLRATGAFERVVDAAGGAPQPSRERMLRLDGEVREFTEVRSGGGSEAVVSLVGHVALGAGPAGRGGRDLMATSREPVAGGDGAPAERLAQAMARALAAAADDLCMQVVEATRDLAAPAAADPPVELDPLLPPLTPAAAPSQRAPGAPANPLAPVLLHPFDAAGAVDRDDLAVRVAPARVEASRGIRWLDRPARMLERAVADALRAGGVALGAEASRPAGGAALDVAATVRRFEIDASGTGRAAVDALDVTAAGASERFEHRVPHADDAGADRIGAAFAAAMGQVAQQAARFLRDEAERAAQTTTPEPADARVEPHAVALRIAPRIDATAPPDAKAPAPLAGLARVLPFEAPEPLHGHEVVLVRGATVIGLRPEGAALAWHRAPATAVEAALVNALRAANVFESVGGAASAGAPRFELRGRLEEFEFHETEAAGGRWEARIAMRIELRRRFAPSSGGGTGAVADPGRAAAPLPRHLVAHGVAQAASASPEDLAAAMNAALARALEEAVAAVAGAARDPGS